MATPPTRRTAALAGLLAVLALPAAQAQVRIDEPWVRGTLDGQMATGAFMRITAPATARLIEASSPLAGVVEIHEMRLDNQVMRMRAVAAVDLPAGQTVELKPGGYHVMLMDLRRTLRPGEIVPIRLVIETAGQRQTVEVGALVRPAVARPPASAAGK